jgi:tetratricopeptide (TPR) repeat protein
MTRRALTFVALLLLPTVASAQKPAPPLDEAKLHFKKGDEHYARKEYDLAITEFKRAYELSKLPLILFNIAQAYRLKGDVRQALAYYEDYLRLDPAAPSRGQVEKRIEELERAIAEEDQKNQPPPPPITTTPPVVTPPSPPVEPPPLVEEEVVSPGRGLRIAGIATAGAGVALATTSVLFALKARGYYDEVSQLSDDGGQWSPAQAEKLDRADRHKLTATLLGIGGGAAVIGGGVLYYLGWRAGRHAGVAIAPTAGGVMLTIASPF